MNILFIGKFFPRDILRTVVADTKGKAEFSNHNFEESLISGFAAQAGVNLRVLTAPNVYSYPHNNRKAFIHAEEYTDNNGVPVHSIGFCNAAVINQWTKPHALAKAIRQELQKLDGDEVHIIVNTPVLELSEAVMSAKRHSGKKIITTVIVPDVRECLLDMEGGAKGLKNKLVARQNRKNAALTQEYDYFVFLTAAMNDYYNVAPEKFMVMEGLFDEKRATQASAEALPEPTSAKEIILYAGSLKRIFGVIDLVEAFEAGKFPDTELWICGMGDSAEEIAARAQQNPAIRFFGSVPPPKALQLQRRATILANPRTADGDYTKYSFPSKTIEYLLAGKSVIMNRLPGVPHEYDQYLTYPEDESRRAWVEAISDIIASDPVARKTRAEAGRNFILENKTAAAQCRRICNFINV